MAEKDLESYQNENYEEAELGQLHAIHLSMNAIENVRSKLSTGPSLSHCMECGDKIPVKRQKAVAGCKFCVECQQYFEKKR